MTLVALGSVVSTPKTGTLHRERFRSLVEDERGRRWVTINCIIQECGDGPEKIREMVGDRRPV